MSELGRLLLGRQANWEDGWRPPATHALVEVRFAAIKCNHENIHFAECIPSIFSIFDEEPPAKLPARQATRQALELGLYTILPLAILYGRYCNKGWSELNTILRNSVGDEEGGGAQTTGVFANHSIDSCTQASNKTNIL